MVYFFAVRNIILGCVLTLGLFANGASAYFLNIRPLSPDGSTLTGGVPGSLLTIGGTWTLDPTVSAVHPGNYSVILNGVFQGGSSGADPSAAALYILNTPSSGTIWQQTAANIWYSWVGAGPWMGPFTDPRPTLSVSNGTLVNASAQPFIMIGDSPQSMIGKLPLCSAGNTFAQCSGSTDAIPANATAVAYLRDRQAQGFNTIQVDLLCASYTTCNNDGTTFDGVAPFTARLGGGCTETTDNNCYDLATPNATYFTRVGDAIKLAAQLNIQALLEVSENSACQTPGWQITFRNNGTTKVDNFGTFVGNTFNWQQP
jgi:hypothetical protein